MKKEERQARLIKRLRQGSDCWRKEHDAMAAALREVRAERDLYRRWFDVKLNWFLELVRAQQKPDMVWLVNDMVALVRRKES